ncbi:unnamed protein product [Lasius platythorax]|uniref:Uncharacterized protein n=1 Tax=Lasius platythorax TaxID=488582 RepID=A0AAV2N6I2_9HYME
MSLDRLIPQKDPNSHPLVTLISATNLRRCPHIQIIKQVFIIYLARHHYFTYQEYAIIKIKRQRSIPRLRHSRNITRKLHANTQHKLVLRAGFTSIILWTLKRIFNHPRHWQLQSDPEPINRAGYRSWILEKRRISDVVFLGISGK